MIANDHISARIKELQTAIAERVVHAAASKRSWRVAALQLIIDRTLATIESRAVMYANQLGESRRLQVRDLAAEQAAIDEGFFEVDDLGEQVAAPTTTYPKRMYHPGYPTGAAHGMLVKDYRGKDANQEIWKYDSGPISKLIDALKHIAMEEGQWTEKRENSPTVSIDVFRARLNAGRQRVVDAKKAALAKGEKWP